MKLQKFQLSNLIPNISNFGTIGAKFVRNIDVRGNIIDVLVNDGLMVKVSPEGSYNQIYAFTEAGRQMAYDMGLVDERGKAEDERLSAKVQPVNEEESEIIEPETEQERQIVESMKRQGKTQLQINDTLSWMHDIRKNGVPEPEVGTPAWAATYMDIKYGMAQTAFLLEVSKSAVGVQITPNNESGYRHTAADGFVENRGGRAFLTPLGEKLIKALV
jgi:hypothetical protein